MTHIVRSRGSNKRNEMNMDSESSASAPVIIVKDDQAAVVPALAGCAFVEGGED
jgi:hypothetical protein